MNKHKVYMYMHDRTSYFVQVYAFVLLPLAVFILGAHVFNVELNCTHFIIYESIWST